MNFYLSKCKIIIDFSFVLMLCFALALGADNILFLLIFSSAHEISHLIMLLLFKGQPDLIRFSFYGVALKYSSLLSKWKEILVILAGPLANLILYLIFRDDINLLLFCLNILPVYPLDGGRILRILSDKVSYFLGCFIILFLLVFSFYVLFAYNSFSLLFITVYLIIYSFLY